jgi:hypothetical protein
VQLTTTAGECGNLEQLAVCLVVFQVGGLAAQLSCPHCGWPLCREDTLTQLFLSSIRKGKEAEIELAAKALGLHVATLGASTASEGIYQEVCWHGAALRCAALRCAVLCQHCR